MGPKKPEIVGDDDDTTWRRIIEEAPLDEENWKVKVVLIEAAGSDQDRIYLNKFETFAAEEKRFVIKNICKTETVFMVNQLGTEKKVRDENLRVFEEGNAFLKEKKDIPPDIFALIIKHLILKMKEEYLFIVRQRLEVKLGMQRESVTMVERAEVRGTVSGAAVGKEPSTPTGGPSNVPELPDEKKFNTLLRERGEEWRDKVYVKDYPTDGPDLYVALTGFVEPFLPGSLVRIGIPLAGVVQVRIDPTTKEIPSSLHRATKRGQSATELLAEQSMKFWEMLQLLRIQEGSADDFKNTAFIVFSPPYWNSDDLSGDPDTIYSELCYLMYDIQDLTRQHTHYLENMDIIKIPQATCRSSHITHYHDLIDDLPLECVTIYSVLDSILGSVCRGETMSGSDSSTTEQHPVNADPIATETAKTSQNLVNNIFDALCNTEAKKQYRITYGEEHEAHKDPIVINYGDFARYKTFHLGNRNLDKIVVSSILGMPLHNLWVHQDPPSGELEAKVNFHVNALLSCFDRDDVETSELNRLLHLLACRKLYNNRSSLKKPQVPPTTISDFKKVYLKRSVLAEPLPCLSISHSSSGSRTAVSVNKTVNEECEPEFSVIDDPPVERIRFLFDCPDISELVSAAEIANNQPMKHMIDDFEYFEDFAEVSAFQIISEAFNKFNCVDYKYCEVTDCFLLMFFNSHDKDGIACNEWRSHLETPVCLQDFFDYILEEQFKWIQNEEKIYDENLVIKAMSESKQNIDQSVIKSCVEDTEVDLDLLIEGSLKHQELVKNTEPSATDLLGLNSSYTALSQQTTEDKSSKKVKSPKILHNFIQSPVDSLPSVGIPAKPFLGYDLIDRRVEIFGKDATFFSKDGTKISTKYSLSIPMNLEYIILNIVPGNSYNEFYIHKALGEFVEAELVDASESFRVIAKDEVIINVKKQMYKMAIPSAGSSTCDKLENADKTGQSAVFTTCASVHEIKYFHSLYITWPNGMITETVHEDNSPVISHIKQYHTCAKQNLNEDMRCISLNGEVIIFNVSGDILVLKPDGTCIKLVSCHKKLIVPENVEEQIDDVSDKSKKSKVAQGKSKKSLKNVLEDDKSLDQKLPEVPEYELVIDEFETLDPNGLRQQYKNEILVKIDKLLVRTATDHVLGEIFSRRMDGGTSVLLNKDGVLLVTFPNKTRIITSYVIDDEEIYPEWTEEEKALFDCYNNDIEFVSPVSSSQRSFHDSESASSNPGGEEELVAKPENDGYVSIHLIFTIEHADFSTVTINKSEEKISIYSPNEATVSIDKKLNYDISLDSVTSAHFDGESLNINYEACPQCKAFTTCNVNIAAKSSGSSLDEHWAMLSDSFNKRVVVNDEGSIFVLEEPSSSEVIHPEELAPELQLVPTYIEPAEDVENNDDKAVSSKPEYSSSSHGQCREMYLAKTIRFLVLRRDLSVSELVHRVLMEQYKQSCRWLPWCSINSYDTFGDHRSIVSIFTPIHLTETEKWLMDSQFADKPKYLTYKDLKEDTGKGFYHWMRPYERFVPNPMKPDNVLPPRLPRAFVLRTLEQQWKETSRDELKGAKELLRAILRYRRILEEESEVVLNVPIIDPRPEEERRMDEALQTIAHELYENLREKLAEDMQSRAKATITTKPLPKPEEPSVEGEMAEGESASESLNEGQLEPESLLQVEQIEEMSPKLARYWRRRAEEKKEEEFYKYLLREGVVPPYFHNVLGGAIWWEMNQTAGQAVDKSERRKMMCVCDEESNKKDNTDNNSTGYTVSAPFV